MSADGLAAGGRAVAGNGPEAAYWHNRCSIIGMTNKEHAMTLPRPMLQDGGFKAHVRGIVAKLKRMVEIPTGYQDETGFHKGTQAAQTEIKWPPQ